MLDPDFLLLDEPAAGLSNDEIARLAEIRVHKEVVSAYLGG
jgi:ABC-type branched-subunit amino acid transport system ATPase component